jgi:hypothetical protein
MLNGQCVTKISNAESVAFEAEPGEIQVYLKIDWFRSNKLDMKVEANQIIKLICGSNLPEPTMYSFMVHLFYTLFLPHKHLWLRYEDS